MVRPPDADIRTMTTKRSLAGRAVLAAAAFALAGCGAQPFPQSEVRTSVPTTAAPVATTPKARLLASMPRATASKTAHIALHMTIGGDDEEGVTFDATGSIDLSRQRMDLKLRSQPGKFDWGFGEIRVFDRTAYVDQNSRWTSVPLDAGFVTLTVPDPTGYVDFLQGIADNVRVDGHEQLRGVDTTRYLATVDLGRALARTATGASQRAAVVHAESLFGDLRFPVTVWLDASGRLRKLSLSMDLSSVAATLGISPTAKIQATVEFYDFGVPVSVQVPSGAIAAKAPAPDAAAQARAAQDRAAQSDLRNALTAEKVQYTDTQEYTASTSILKQIEPSLDWGGKLTVAVAGGPGGTASVVCLAEKSASGTRFALADIATGPAAGAYYSWNGCPVVVDDLTITHLGSGW